MVGHVRTEAEGRVLSAHLSVEGIENRVEAEPDGSWAVWAHSEDQLEHAATLLREFSENPGDPRYGQAIQRAQDQRRAEERAAEAAKRRFFDRGKLFPERFYGLGVLTAGLIAVSILVTLISGFGDAAGPRGWLSITRYRFEDGFILWRPGLSEIQRGELWRLFTPAFIHFGILHLLFNMLWLKDLGSLIEHLQGRARLLALVLVLAALSNLVQYQIGGPSFGGMSGVVYGLLGYVWLRGRLDPASGLHVDRQTMIFMMVWFFLCLFHIIPNVANAAHGAGFAVGLLWGGVSAWSRGKP
jgi:GlpG protein